MNHEDHIWGPFLSPFYWSKHAPLDPSAPPPPADMVNPLGHSKEEAKTAAWLFTAGARIENEQQFAHLAGRVQYFTYLNRITPRMSSIEKMLSTLGSNTVHLDEIETHMGDFWGDIWINSTDECNKEHKDPYYWQQVVSIFKASIEDWLTRLDMTLSSLCGMDREQCTTNVYSDVCGVKNAIKDVLCELLLARKVNTNDLRQAVTNTQARLVEPRIDNIKSRIRKHISSVTALQKVAAVALCDSSNVDSIITQYEDNIQIIALDPPFVLVDALAEKNVNLDIPHSCFAHHAQRLFESCSFPAMAAHVRQTILVRWVTEHAAVLSEACASALSSLKRIVKASSTDSYIWSGVTVCSANDIQGPCWGSQFVAKCPMPSHGSDSEEFFIVAQAQRTHFGVRAARLFDAVLQIVEQGRLPLRTVRANKILPVFARAVVEQTATRDSIVAHEIEPTGTTIGVRWQRDTCVSKRSNLKRSSAHDPDSDSETIAPLGFSTRHSENPAVLSVLQDTVVTGVSKKLVRDHAILQSICILLKKRQTSNSSSIRLHEIAEQAIRVEPSFQKKSAHSRSLNQSIASVIKKTIDLYNKALQTNGYGSNSGSVRYDKNRMNETDGFVGGLVMDRSGALAFLQYCANWCSRMQTGEDRVVDMWRPSRSCIAHAKVPRR